MKDQYSFLKAIDTSSSSPELINEQEARTRLKQISSKNKKRGSQATATTTATTSSNGQTTTASSSSINSKLLGGGGGSGSGGGGGGGLRSRIQNLVKPIKFHNHQQQRQQQQQQLLAPIKRSSLAISTKKTPAQESDTKENENVRERLFSSLTSGKQKLSDNGNMTKRTREQQIMPMYQPQQQQQQHKILTAPKQTRANPNSMAISLAPSLAQTSETQAASSKQNEPELTRCYEEIDQIYDYIRGLAPLPANLRKIKSIDFEQLERERQKLAERQQQQQQQLQVQHHQHRQRYVRSIAEDSATKTTTTTTTSGSHNSTDSATPPTSSSSTTRRLVKARQRNVADLLQDDKNVLKPPSVAATRAVVPMPIRVTTKSSESYKPSIKRVESLNLGQLRQQAHTSAEKCTPVAKLLSRPSQVRTDAAASHQQMPSVTSASLSKPSYLISTTQRGQLFRLPRAHSTSTLNKPSLLSNTGGSSSYRRASQATTTTKEPIIQENFPLARLSSSGTQKQLLTSNRLAAAVAAAAEPQQTNSLGRVAMNNGQATRYKKRFSFESDLVESFVDDDDDENEELEAASASGPTSRGTTNGGGNHDETSRVAEIEKSASQSSSSSSSSSSSEDNEQQTSSASSSSSSSSSARDRLSAKSHSDYENDSDEANSESITTVTSETTTTTTTTDTSNEDEDARRVGEAQATGVASDTHSRGLLKRDRRDHKTTATTTLSSMSPFSAGSAGTGKRSQRPTTSSSPSSGRPASPADETNDSDDDDDDERETDVLVNATTGLSSTSRQQRSSPLSYRQMLPRVQAPREEHIYEQIPAHKSLELHRQQQQQQQHQLQSGRQKSNSIDSSTNQLPKFAGAQSHKQASSATIKHPIAYAANVAVNRRYQQQVAALFALQQQRDRALSRRQSHMTAAQPPAPLRVSQMYNGGHQRRASASNTQFMPEWRQDAGASMRPSDHGHSHRHHQHRQQLADVPHRHRLSMGNIHLLTSGLPLASLYPSPKHSARSDRKTSEKKERRSSQNTNSLDDQEACSTGTTNSTSSYEAAIKNSDPNPLRIDMIAGVQQPQQESETRHSSGRRSVGSGSGSRSLTNHLQMHNAHLHQQQQQQQQHSSTLVKVPKLSKQSHLLQRPLPKPPNHRSNNPSKHSVKASTGNRLSRTAVVPTVFN